MAGDRARPRRSSRRHYVIKGGDVSWSPAVDVNRIILGGPIVAIVAPLTARAIVKARGRR